MVLSILCSLGLMWAPMAGAQTAPARAPHACCHCGGKMACCAQRAPLSQPLPSNPVPAGTHNQLSLAPRGVVTWILPDVPQPQFSSIDPALSLVAASPLYALDCARLI